MPELVVRKAPLPWLAGGLLLGLVQVAAVGLSKPLGVSTEFVVADTKILQAAAPSYVQNHKLIGNEKYQKLGYGWWLDVGIVVGACLAALLAGRWRLQAGAVWWAANRGKSVGGRLVACFVGGFLILFGARLAHGCTSGQMASGWAQLSLAAIPFTITLFGFGILTAMIAHPKVPRIEA